MTNRATGRLQRIQATKLQQVGVRLVLVLMALFMLSFTWSFRIQPWTHFVSFHLGRGCFAIQIRSSAPSCPRIILCEGHHPVFSGEYYLIASFDSEKDVSRTLNEKVGMVLPHLSGSLNNYNPPHFVCPIWFPGVLLGIALWIQAKRRAANKDCCIACGYNLTGNISGRCPECGTELVK